MNRRCALCGFAAGHGRGKLVHVEQVNAWYHEGGCLDAAQETYSTSGGQWGRMPSRYQTRVSADSDPVVEVDAGKPTRVTVTAGSAETVTPTIGAPLRPPTNLKRGSLAMVGAEYEPGNGTRYQLMLLTVPLAKPMLVWTNGPGGGRSMFVPHSGLAVSYIAEKLGCNAADAEAIALFLRHAT